MARIDFLISNDLHHTALFRRVIGKLGADSNHAGRVISLCEFRGRSTPSSAFQASVPVLQLIPRLRRSSATGRQTQTPFNRLARRLARQISWRLILERPIKRWLAYKPDLVVLANDAAFPYDRITAIFRSLDVPFLLVQEGIRFPIPSCARNEIYGANGAVAVAAWGKSSANYFLEIGVAPNRIYLTGNPLFDEISAVAWRDKASSLKAELGLGDHNLLLLSNPIDDQGFCTTKEKVSLIRQFVHEIEPLFKEPDFHLIIKLHGRESEHDFWQVTNGLPIANRVKILKDAQLYPLFALSQAAVILASTAGLEALLFGLPLGVLEIPGHGFVYDYVRTGAAQGLDWRSAMSAQIQKLLNSGGDTRLRIEAYLAHSLATRNGASERVAELVESLACNA